MTFGETLFMHPVIYPFICVACAVFFLCSIFFFFDWYFSTKVVYTDQYYVAISVWMYKKIYMSFIVINCKVTSGVCLSLCQNTALLVFVQCTQYCICIKMKKMNTLTATLYNCQCWWCHTTLIYTDLNSYWKEFHLILYRNIWFPKDKSCSFSQSLDLFSSTSMGFHLKAMKRGFCLHSLAVSAITQSVSMCVWCTPPSVVI